MSEQNKALARRGLEEIWNQVKLTVIDELVASNATYHDANVPGGKFTGPEGLKRRATRSSLGGPQPGPTRAS